MKKRTGLIKLQNSLGGQFHPAVAKIKGRELWEKQLKRRNSSTVSFISGRLAARRARQSLTDFQNLTES